MPYTLKPGDALIVVDVQKDYCPGGPLPVENAQAVMAALNGWIEEALARKVPVYLSRDWHPRGHISFRKRGGPWPPHCLQGSDGARFHPQLLLSDSCHIVTKGMDPDREQSSPFDGTGLADQLRQEGVKRLWIGGLSKGLGVSTTALDGCREGFEVILIADATRPTLSWSIERAPVESPVSWMEHTA